MLSGLRQCAYCSRDSFPGAAASTYTCDGASSTPMCADNLASAVSSAKSHSHSLDAALPAVCAQPFKRSCRGKARFRRTTWTLVRLMSWPFFCIMGLNVFMLRTIVWTISRSQCSLEAAHNTHHSQTDRTHPRSLIQIWLILKSGKCLKV